jgi:hypothetical protein
MYSHAGSFVRREVAAKTKSGKKVEVYYYDGNLNHMCAIGAATIAAEPMDFEKVFRQYDALKIYALSARKLRKVTEDISQLKEQLTDAEKKKLKKEKLKRKAEKEKKRKRGEEVSDDEDDDEDSEEEKAAAAKAAAAKPPK